MEQQVPLSEAPLQQRLTLVGVPADRREHLASVGLRPGVQVRVLQRTSGGGRTLAVGTSRIAVGADLLPLLTAAVVPA